MAAPSVISPVIGGMFSRIEIIAMIALNSSVMDSSAYVLRSTRLVDNSPCSDRVIVLVSCIALLAPRWRYATYKVLRLT